MSKEENALYVQQFCLWLEEQMVRTTELSNCVDTSMKIAELNKKQLGIHIKRVNLAIAEYNEWAKNNGHNGFDLL